MAWFKKFQSTNLYQSSDIPYVILDNHVLLCFDNLYSTRKENNSEFSISFQADKKQITTQSATLYRLNTFPEKIKLNNVDFVNNIKVSQLKKNAKKTIDSESIALVNYVMLKRMSDRKFDNFTNQMSDYDHKFLLTNDKLGYMCLKTDNILKYIYHSNNNWHKTCAEIAYNISIDEPKDINWTKNIPSLDIYCFGLQDRDIIKKIGSSFNDMGINSCISWEE